MKKILFFNLFILSTIICHKEQEYNYTHEKTWQQRKKFSQHFLSIFFSNLS